MENPTDSLEETRYFKFIAFRDLFTESWMKVEYIVQEDQISEDELKFITNSVERKNEASNKANREIN